MPYWKFRPVVVVPAAQVDAFNKILQRHGYGPNCLVKGEANAVVAKDAAKGATPTHYVFEPLADAGFVAAIKLALAAVNAQVSAASKGVLETAMRSVVGTETSKIETVLEKSGKQLNVSQAVVDEGGRGVK